MILMTLSLKLFFHPANQIILAKLHNSNMRAMAQQFLLDTNIFIFFLQGKYNIAEKI